MLASNKSSLGTVDRSEISSVSHTSRLRPLLASTTERRVRQCQFVNNDISLCEKSHSAVVSNDRSAAEPSPSASVEFDGRGETAVDGRRTAAKHQRSDDIEDNNCGTEGNSRDETAMDSKARRERFSAPVQAMLLVVTADMVAVTAQIGESDLGCSAPASTSSCDAGACIASSTAKPLDHIPQNAS